MERSLVDLPGYLQRLAWGWVRGSQEAGRQVSFPPKIFITNIHTAWREPDWLSAYVSYGGSVTVHVLQ
jgi:hypothetical protein